MDGGTSESMNQWTNAWVKGESIQPMTAWNNKSRTQNSMRQWLTEPMTHWTNESMNQWINELMKPWVNEQKNEDRSLDGRKTALINKH